MFKYLKNVMKRKEAKLILLIIIATVLIYSTSETDAVVSEAGIIERNGYDEGASTVIVAAEIENVGTERIELDIQNRQYSGIQCDDLYNQCREELFNIVLNGNVDFSNVSEDLNLIAEMEGFPFEFSWYVADKRIIDEDGKLIAHERGETVIYLTASYYDWKKEESIEVMANAVKSLDANIIKNDVAEAIRKEEEETREDELLVLPTEIDGLKITYSDGSSNRTPLFFLFPIAASFALIWGSKRDRQKQENLKKELIISEYAIVIQKMVMYLSSGMSLRNVWTRIYEDSISQKKNNPIYSEMEITVNELKNGVSEIDAYSGFSKRIGIPAITRFTTLISQNLKKGSTNLSVLLAIEAKEAFEDRKRRARVKGELAGTKLLLPMMLLLIMVMVIIMMPAFWSI